MRHVELPILESAKDIQTLDEETLLRLVNFLLRDQWGRLGNMFGSRRSDMASEAGLSAGEFHPTVNEHNLMDALDVALTALRLARGFVECVSGADDWCGCEYCRKEWMEHRDRFKVAIDKAESVKKSLT